MRGPLKPLPAAVARWTVTARILRWLDALVAWLGVWAGAALALPSASREALALLAVLGVALGALARPLRARSPSGRTSTARTRSPTSIPSNPRTTFPSAGGRSTRAHVPLTDAPVTIASNRSPIRDARRSAAADFRTWRSTLSALSSCSVQRRASAASSASVYGAGRPASAALRRRWVMRSGNRRRSEEHTSELQSRFDLVC